MNRIPDRKLLCIVLLVMGLMSVSCSVTKHIPDDESLYDKVRIKLEPQGRVPGQRRVTTQLEELVPEPDKSLWGWRPGLWLYYATDAANKKKGLAKKFSREPILMDDINPEMTAIKMEGSLNNNGYFGSQVRSDIETRNKKSTVTYTVFINPPFRIAKVNNMLVDSADRPNLYNALQDRSLLRLRQRFNVERFQAEQQRMEGVMENFGYYYFDDQHLIFEADTTIGKRRVSIDVKLEEEVPARAMQVYHMNQINIIPDYDLENRNTKTDADTVQINGYNYIGGNENFRPEIITRAINLLPDSIYRRVDHEYTLSHLMGLKAFKFVNIKYEVDEEDTTSLNANIFLTPLLKKSLRLQGQATSKSNNFIGPGLELTFTNRNFLRGAELLQFKLQGSYEVQISRSRSGSLHAMQLGAESSISIPRFITPVSIPYRYGKYVPQTQIRVGANLQERLQYYRLTSFNAAFGYLWRETTVKTHELFPVDVSYVKLGKTSLAFDQLLDLNPYLASTFQDQFIIGGRYSFTYNTQIKEDIEQRFTRAAVNRSDYYFNGGLDVSGNVLRAIQRLGVKDEQQGRLFSQPFSQFIKADVDLRYYRQLNRRSKFAARFYTGVGYAYGNSQTLPYVKQFGVGGSNSVRAFPARSIGPGTYNVRTDPNIASDTYFIDQRGDIKLEGNAEYRFDIVKALKGAVFVDAGNIWLRREDPERPGSGFDFNTALQELAVGTGAGLRVDLSFFVLRFDGAFPLRKPYLPEGERWVSSEDDFGSGSWWWNNLVLNIAIGYPF